MPLHGSIQLGDLGEFSSYKALDMLSDALIDIQDISGERVSSNETADILLAERSYNQPFASYCSDLSVLFSEASIVYNCVVVSAVAMQVQDGYLTMDDDSIAAVNESLKLEPLETFDYRGILGSVYNCRSAVCHAGTFGSCNNLEPSPRKNTREFLRVLAYNLSGGECAVRDDSRELKADDDVAGKGIIISYLIQVALAFFFCSLTNILSYWANLFRAFIRLWKKKKQGQVDGIDSSQDQPRSFIDTMRASRLAVALFSSLVEFQEVQLFFVFAFQVATVATYLNWTAENLLNVRAASFFATVQVFPGLLVQSTLQRIGMRWWYTFSLTLAVYILGIVVDQMLLFTPDMKGLDECGGSEYFVPGCIDQPERTVSGDFARRFARVAVALSHPIMAALIVDEMACILPWRKLKKYPKLEKNFRPILAILKYPKCHTILQLRWLAIDLVSYGVLAVYLLLVSLGFFFSNALYPDLTYGQVVALLPWAPVMAKYFYMSLFGVVDGVGRRIDPRYVVMTKLESEKSEDLP